MKKKKDISPVLVRLANQRTAMELSDWVMEQSSPKSFRFVIVHSAGVTAEDFDALMALLEDNVRTYYEQSEWGWNAKSKAKEMRQAPARFLIARHEDSGALAGFCHFRFDMDYGRAVLYCYEIQVGRSFQRNGLGSAFISVLQALALNARMKLIVVTVFRHNEPSLNFFRKHSFVEDAVSPPDKDYVILSRTVHS